MSAPATTVDRFLDGRLTIEQPASGRHRAGLDALLLAAAVPAEACGVVVDLGAGVGTAGLAVAARVAGVTVRLAERDTVAVDLAVANAARSENAAFGGRVEVLAVDLMAGAKAREAILPRESAAWVICNPPYYAAGEVRASPRAARAAAHVLAGTLDDWLRVAAATLEPHGRLALIFKGDGLGEILSATAGRFGAIAVTPIHPRAEEPAHRLVVTAIKGSRARPVILPGLVLHPTGDNAYLPDADAVLRGLRGLGADVAGTRHRAPAAPRPASPAA